MKIVLFENINSIDKTWNDIHDDSKYIVNTDIYNYFFDEIYYKNFINYIKIVDQKLFNELQLKPTTPELSYKLSKARFSSERLHSKNFHKQRVKFYNYKDNIYSYTYLGMANIGHEIEIIQYDNNDLMNLLNSLIKQDEKPSWKNILNIR